MADDRPIPYFAQKKIMEPNEQDFKLMAQLCTGLHTTVTALKSQVEAQIAVMGELIAKVSPESGTDLQKIFLEKYNERLKENQTNSPLMRELGRAKLDVFLQKYQLGGDDKSVLN